MQVNQWFPRGVFAEAQGSLKGELLRAKGRQSSRTLFLASNRASLGINRVFKLANIYNKQIQLTPSCFVCFYTQILASGSLLHSSISLAYFPKNLRGNIIDIIVHQTSYISDSPKSGHQSKE